MRSINGMFPYNNPQNKGLCYDVRNAVVEVISPSNIRWVQPAEMTALIQPACERARAAHAGTYRTTGASASWFGPYSCIVSGNGMNIPSYINAQLFPRVKTNTGKRWKEHKRNSDIIVTDAIRGSLQLDFKPGLSSLQTMGLGESLSHRAKDTGLYPVTSDGYVVIDGRKFVDFPIYKHYIRAIGNEDRDPRQPGFNIKTYEFGLKAALASHLIDEPLVVECLADANASTVELLSTLAEMPETVKQALSAIRTIIDMYKETRKKAFRIYNKGGIGSAANTAWRNSVECADAIVSVWMAWRFGIRPNVYLLEDCIDILYSEKKDFIRTRKFVQKDFTVPSPGLSPVTTADVPIRLRCFIKRLYDISRPEALLMQRLTINGAIALYELTPLSWALDYFVNLGDIVSSNFNNTPALAEGSTFSWQVIDQTVSFGSPEQGFINVRLALYRRDVINPSSITCLSFNSDLGFDQIFDLISVGWNIFKNDLPRDVKVKYKPYIPYTE